MQEFLIAISSRSMETDRVRSRSAIGLVAVFALVIGGLGPVALAQTVSAEDVAAAEAEAAAAADKLDQARGQLANA